MRFLQSSGARFEPIVDFRRLDVRVRIDSLLDHLSREDSHRITHSYSICSKSSTNKNMKTCLLLLFSTAVAFQPATVSRRSWTMVSTRAEKHLDELIETWESLKKKEQKLIQENLAASKNAENSGIDFVEELFETALDYVQTKEIVEEEHADMAHHMVEEAIEGERVLENYAHDEMPHGANIEDFVESKLQAAKEAEKHAREDEEEAKRSLEELKRNEEYIKTTMEELRKLKPKAKP